MNDDELLNDLLDDRLAPADEAALRARIEVEPALGEAWEELCRVNTLVRDHTAWTDTMEPPAALAAAVRARTTGAADEARKTSAGRRPAGRLLRMLTVAYAAAALLVVVLTAQWALDERGAETLDAPGGETTTAARDVKEERLADARTRGDEPVAKETAGLARVAEREQPAAAEPVAGPETSEGRPAPESGFRMGGSVPPAMRPPRDAGEAAPASDRLRKRASDARPREWVYVIEADDAEVGLREARRLLASLADTPSKAKKAPAAPKETESDGAPAADEEAAAPVWRLRALEAGGSDEHEAVTSITETLSAASHRRLRALAAAPSPGAGKKDASFEQAAKDDDVAREKGAARGRASAGAPTPSAPEPSAPAPGGSGGGGGGAAAPAAPTVAGAKGKHAEATVRVRILILRRR